MCKKYIYNNDHIEKIYTYKNLYDIVKRAKLKKKKILYIYIYIPEVLRLQYFHSTFTIIYSC